MPTTAEFERLKRVADAKVVLVDAIGKSDERDIAIWIAALAEQLQRFAEQQLQDETDE